ncbi:DNA topoisomerase [Marasmius crinis-equi]|uniref:DNA topoisomerase n=1 Tax=Marasmius crinis-equi TaxID=585013 RepID=A0ABR3G294_9AGAR
MARVLCVAEKPSISKAITQILSGGRFSTRDTRSKFIKNYDFDYPQTNSEFTVTAVAGHLTETEFTDAHRKWNSCDPVDLFDAPIITYVKSDYKAMEINIFNEAKRASTLMIWTDCDREGEHIGSEIANVARRAKPGITVKRARFSAIVGQQIHHAAQHPVELDMRLVHAVEARIAIDLKIGAAFTRYQTYELQNRIEKDGVISYGPCQFPALGFVVSRFKDVRDFRPEKFWFIYLAITSDSGQETTFNWKRGHLFGEDEALVIYEHVMENPRARVTKVERKETKKWKPLPLTTVELQKAGSRLLKLSPKRVLDIAEKLYQQGFLSYPRTETDQYDPQFDFRSLIEKQRADPAWGGFATSLQEGEFNAPRKGKNNDKAHPPIHPTAHAGNLAGDDKKVYEYIARRFLASCSKDAKGWQTTVDVICGDEHFSATGLTVTERNYLVVYPYEKWNDNELPDFEEGNEFEPAVCELRDGQTTKPSYLTEADLVTLMDKNGIGTDATIAQHIETIINREYVIEQYEGATKYLLPSTLGIGLVDGYSQMNLNNTSLSKPLLRRETERRMVKVGLGETTKEVMMQESLAQYKAMYEIVRTEFNKVRQTLNLIECSASCNILVTLGINRQAGATTGGVAVGAGEQVAGAGAAVVAVAVAMEDTEMTPTMVEGRAERADEVEEEEGEEEARPPVDEGTHLHPEEPVQPQKWNLTMPPSSRAAPRPPNSSTSSRAVSTATSQGPPTSTAPRKRFTIKLCDCGEPAIEKTTSGGKKILCCGSGKCKLFEWVEARPPTSSAVSKPSTSSHHTSVSEEPPQCNCKVSAARRTVTKEGPNTGRMFWTCGNDRTCNYFQFVDELPSTIHAERTHLTSTNSEARDLQTQGGANFSSTPEHEEAPLCDCKVSADQRTVTKDGVNKGRKFWTCGNNRACNFFQFLDDPPSTVPTKRTYSIATGSDARGSENRGGATSGTCYKCNEEGHWAANCPNDGGSAKKVRGNAGTSSSSPGACFKCSEEGHWASNCPNDNGSTKNSRGFGNSASNITSNGMECFKCHEPGHFSNGAGLPCKSNFTQITYWRFLSLPQFRRYQQQKSDQGRHERFQYEGTEFPGRRTWAREREGYREDEIRFYNTSFLALIMYVYYLSEIRQWGHGVRHIAFTAPETQCGQFQTV